MLHRALVVCLFFAPLAIAQEAVPGRDVQPEARPTPEEARVAYVRMATSMGDIVIELDPEKAPISVANFLAHVDRRSYDGSIFHRVIPTFVIQGGGHDADLTERAKRDAEAGNPDNTIRNEWENGLKNVRGTIAMARESEPDSATRQFYINVADNPRLDTARETTGNAGYAVFGRVVAGMDVVDRIREVPTREVSEEMKNVPVEAVLINSVRRISNEDGERAKRPAEPPAQPVSPR